MYFTAKTSFVWSALIYELLLGKIFENILVLSTEWIMAKIRLDWHDTQMDDMYIIMQVAKEMKYCTVNISVKIHEIQFWCFDYHLGCHPVY